MLTIILFIAACRGAFAERPLPPRTGNLEFGGAYSYYTSSANYDADANKVADPNGGGLSTNSGLLTGAYDLSAHFRLSAGLIYADTSTTDGFFDRDNGAVTEVPMGAQYFGAFDHFLWVAQADAGLTLYHVSETSDAAAIAEGVNRVRGGGWLIYRGGQFQPFVYLAGEYRDAGRSSLLPYAAGLHLKVENFWLQAAVQGYFALGNDSDSAANDRARREAYLRIVNGGSYRYYAVNPSLHELEVQAGLRFNQFNVYVGGTYALYGQSTAQGYGLIAGVRFTMPTGGRSKASDASYQGPDENGFAPKEETYDETLFHEKPAPPRRPPPPPVAAPTPPPRVQLIPKRKKKRTSRKIERQQENLNKLLNDTEQNLEHK